MVSLALVAIRRRRIIGCHFDDLAESFTRARVALHWLEVAQPMSDSAVYLEGGMNLIDGLLAKTMHSDAE